MSKIQEGHLDLLGVLFARHSQRAYSHCFRIVGNGEASEDLVQEAFLRVLRFRSSFRGESSFSTWFYRIVRNVCYDHLKAEKSESAAFDRLAIEQKSHETHVAIDDTEVSVTRIAFGKLSADQQQLLIMARVDGFGYREIASKLGITEGAARVRVHRTIAELQSIIDDLSGVTS